MAQPWAKNNLLVWEISNWKRKKINLRNKWYNIEKMATNFVMYE